MKFTVGQRVVTTELKGDDKIYGYIAGYTSVKYKVNDQPVDVYLIDLDRGSHQEDLIARLPNCVKAVKPPKCYACGREVAE